LIRLALPGRLLILAGLAGFLTLGAAYWWPFELVAHFRVQYVALAFVLAIPAFVLRQRIPALILMAAAAVNAWPLLPYLPSSMAADIESELNVLNINVKSDNARHAEIIDSILAAGPDLVTILELTHELDAALLTIADDYPYRYTLPGVGNFGIGVLSRYPLIDPRSFTLLDTPGIDSLIELPGRSLRLLAVHLMPPMGSELATERNRQLTELATLAGEIDEPLLVCGDFNLSPYSPFFSAFTEDARLLDTRLGKGLDFSWPAFMPLLGIPIDHCLVRSPLAAASVTRLEPVGSDHYPVQVAITWLLQI
jgi:endonuclease/exonuclease/phosphatase (EEP) superfamily protein YafD